MSNSAERHAKWYIKRYGEKAVDHITALIKSNNDRNLGTSHLQLVQAYVRLHYGL